MRVRNTHYENNPLAGLSLVRRDSGGSALNSPSLFSRVPPNLCQNPSSERLTGRIERLDDRSALDAPENIMAHTLLCFGTSNISSPSGLNEVGNHTIRVRIHGDYNDIEPVSSHTCAIKITPARGQSRNSLEREA